MNSIFHRTSFRSYKRRRVEKQKVELLLRSAMASPSVGNQQPWEFYVVYDDDVLAKLAECNPYAGCIAEAPLAIVTCYRLHVTHPQYAKIDVSKCTKNLLLEAKELELGAVWVGVAPLKDRMKRVKQILSIPEGIEAYAIIPIGYPTEEASEQEQFTPRRIHVVDGR